MLTSILVAIIVTIVVGIIERMLYCRDDGHSRRMYGVTEEQIAVAIGSGLAVGVIHHLIFNPGVATAWLPPLLTAFVLAIMVLVAIWWRDDRYGGSSAKEMLGFIVLTIVLFVVAMDGTKRSAGLIEDGFFKSLVLVIPWIVLVGVIGYILATYYFFRSEVVDYTDDGISYNEQNRASSFHRTMGRAVAVVAILVILAILATSLNWGNFKWPSLTTKKSSGTAPWYAYYNFALLYNNNPDDDFNFGYNPREAFPDWENAENAASLFDANFRERMTGTEEKGADFVLGTASMAWLDANCGTRYLGEFYESCKEDWAKTMNAASAEFKANETLYRQRLEAFFLFLDSAKKVEVKDAGQMTDQMYMNPYTKTRVPDIIVFKTDEHVGKFLVYTFSIKDNLVEVAYRIDCGYQPTNVEQVMRITPQDKPGGGGHTPTSTPGKGDYPTPPPANVKDPNKAPKENTEPNDDKGPGPDTNSGQGKTESTRDQSTNSNHMPYTEYKEQVKELEEANESQKQGGDPNIPSTTPPSGTKVDSNADTGTGNGSIDKPSTEASYDKPADGSAISSDSDGAWGGPPD